MIWRDISAQRRTYVAVAKRALGAVAVQPAEDRADGVAAGLNRDLGRSRQAIEAHQVADHEYLGVSGQCAVGVNRIFSSYSR